MCVNVISACSDPGRFCKASRAVWYQLLPSYRRANKTSGRHLRRASSCQQGLCCFASLFSNFKDKVSWNRKMAEKGRRLEFRRETSVCVLCVRERICGVAAAVLVAALQLILGPRRHVPRRAAMVL